MGNSASSSRAQQEETVDFGHLTPQGIYTGPRDWNQTIVSQLIIDRKLAPFYRPLEDYEEDWDDDQILAARKEPPDPDGVSLDSSSGRPESINSSNSRMSHNKRPSSLKEPSRYPEAAIYRGAVECPICFLVGSASIYLRCYSSPTDVIRHSIIHPTSITRDAVTRRYAQNVLYRLNEPNPLPHISFRSLQRVLIAYGITLAWCTHHLPGAQGWAVMARSVEIKQ